MRKKKHKLRIARLGSAILSAVMLFTSVPVFAQAEIPEYPLASAALSEVPDGDYVYMGTVSASVTEGNAYYTASVYRTGDLSKSASVRLNSLDVSAIYGKDYELVADDVIDLSDGKSLIEKNAEQSELTSLNETTTEEAANILEAAEGTEIADINEEDAPGLKDAIMSFAEDQSNGYDMDYSASQPLTFEAGESQKTIRFRIYDDNKSEGQEAFTLLLDAPENVDIHDEQTMSVVIEDDEEDETSEVGFTKAEYKSEEGVATVVVRRRKAEYSLCTLTIKTVCDTAMAEENYTEKYETIAFSPYETEKEITFDVSGEGMFEVHLADFTGCEEGKITKTSVQIVNENTLLKRAEKAAEAVSEKIFTTVDAEDADQNEEGLEAEKESSFSITYHGQKYDVVYSGDDPEIGKIMNPRYTPPLQVGEYYFPTTKNFFYNKNQHFGDSASNDTIEYHGGEKVGERFGVIEWYSSWWHDEGGTTTSSKAGMIPSIFYQCYVPDWESRDTRISFGNELFRINLFAPGRTRMEDVAGAKHTNEKFGRILDERAIIPTRPDIDNLHLMAEITSEDNEFWQTPWNYLRFYGIAAFYKRYSVSVGEYSKLEYNTAEGGKIASEPFEVTMNTGAKPLDPSDLSHIVYLNRDAKASNLVFSTSDISLNGHLGKFGVITGYTITVNPSSNDNRFDLSYPNDFIDYLDEQGSRGTPVGSCVDYSKKAVDAEKSKITNSLDTVPYDEYFADWITNCAAQNKKYAPVKIGGEWEIQLKFEPIFGYSNVTVTVQDPIFGEGSFNNRELEAGKTIGNKFHAGDELDLSCTATGLNQVATGYQVSEDGGIFYNSILSQKSLFLEPNKSYIIRPLIETQENRIEIVYENSEAEQNLSIQSEYGLLSKEDTGKVEHFQGKNILICNPSEKDSKKRDSEDVKNMAKPKPGKDYSINILVTGSPSDSDYVYRPVVKVVSDPYNNKCYNTQSMPIIAKQDFRENVITIGIEKVKKSDLKEYNIKGTLYTSHEPLRATGTQVKESPVVDYVVSAASSQMEEDGKQRVNTISAVSDPNGLYEMKGLTGKSGDVIPLLCSNGFTAGQMSYVRLGDLTDMAIDRTKIHYPYDAPKVKGIMYTYDSQSHNQQQILNENTIRIYDDNLNLRATVDSNGRKISKLIFTVTTENGNTTHYEALPEAGNPGVYSVKIKKLTENVFSGDRITVRVVDEEKRLIDVGGTSTEIEIQYPVIDTGLAFYLENMPIVPQEYAMTDAPEVNIPLVGSAKGSATSGLLSFDRTDWKKLSDGTVPGYTLSINVGMGYDSILDKLGALDRYRTTVNQAHRQRSNLYPDENALRSEQIIYNSLLGRDLDTDDQEQWQDLVKEKHASIQNLKKRNSKAAKESMAKMNGTTWKVDVVTLISMNYVYNPVRKKYIYACGSVAIGGTFTCSYTKYTVLSGCPCFLNVSGTFQEDCVVSYTTKDGTKAMTAGDFSTYRGNIAETLGTKDDKANLTLLLGGRIGAGIGMCGVVSGGGFVDLSTQFLINCKGQGYNGTLLKAGGSIEINALITTFNLKVVQFTKGWGAYKGSDRFDFFGGMLKGSKAVDADAAYTTEGGTVLSESNDGEVISEQDLHLGTDDLSSFGKNEALQQDSDMTASVLLSGAAEYSHAQLAELSDGRMFLAFVGAGSGRSAKNASAVYYTISGENGWAEPKLASDDGTFDTAPAVEVDGDKVYLSWLNANRLFEEDTESLEIAGALNPVLSVYDSKSGSMSEPVVIAENDGDDYYGIPQVKALNGTVNVSVQNLNFDECENVLEVLNQNTGLDVKNYSYSEADGIKERSNLSNEDQVLLEHQNALAKIGKRTYSLGAYATKADNEKNTVYLKISDLNKEIDYADVPVLSNANYSSLKLTDANGRIFLTCLKNGYEFEVIDLTEILSDLFSEEYRSVYEADASSPQWYVKTAKQLGISDDQYPGTRNHHVAVGNWMEKGQNLKNDDKLNTNISDYQIAHYGEDLYIFYTDYVENEIDAYTNNREIFCVCYNRYESSEAEDESGEVKDDSDDEPEDDYEKRWGFTDPLQMTDCDSVISGMSVFMSDDGTVHLVADVYQEWLVGDGDLARSENELTEFNFKVVKDKLIVKPESVEFDFYGSDHATIGFTVQNAGLGTAEGFNYKVVNEKTGQKIAGGVINQVLRAADTYEMQIPWIIKDDLEDTSICISVGLDKEMTCSVASRVPYKECLEFDNIVVSEEGDGLKITGEVTNYGNKDSAGGVVSVGMADEYAEMIKSYDSMEFPAVKAGEREKFSMMFSLPVKDYSEMGTVDLLLNHSGGADYMTTHVVVGPEEALINNGMESVSVEGEESIELSAEAYPYDSIAGEKIWWSNDTGIAEVDQNGKVYGVSKGTVEIGVYYPLYGLSDTITVNVTRDKSYGITVLPSEHGKVEVSASEAKGEETVTITVTPEEFYRLETLTVRDKNNCAVDVRKTEEGTYEFIMQGGPITIEAQFLHSFVDVEEDDYFYDSVNWAVRNDVTTGTDETHFSPDAICTRGQMVTFLWRADGKPEVNTEDIQFEDVAPHKYYAPAVKWAASTGITNGVTETTFAPDQPVTREQLATFIYRYAQLRGEKYEGDLVINPKFADANLVSKYAVEAVCWATMYDIIRGVEENRLDPKGTVTRAQIVTMLYRYFETRN